MKVNFLVTVICPRRVGKLQALVSDPPYTVFYKDKVYFFPHPKFLTKVALHFHINQPVYLPTFFHEPSDSHKDKERFYSLTVRRALAFSLESTKPFRFSLAAVYGSRRQFEGSSSLISKNFIMDFLLHTYMLLCQAGCWHI